MGGSPNTKNVLREITCLQHHVMKLSDGQVNLIGIDDENIRRFVIEVTPNDGPYKGGRFKFAFRVPVKYPLVPPNIQCLNHIYHPNIDDDGEICLSILDDWEPKSYDIESCILGVLFLFHHPNLEDPLSPYFSPEDSNDLPLYFKNVKTSIQGGIVDGFKFERTAFDSFVC